MTIRLHLRRMRVVRVLVDLVEVTGPRLLVHPL